MNTRKGGAEPAGPSRHLDCSPLDHTPCPAWATDCPQHYAAGVAPIIVKSSLRAHTQELCFEAYAVMHSGVSRTPDDRDDPEAAQVTENR